VRSYYQSLKGNLVMGFPWRAISKEKVLKKLAFFLQDYYCQTIVVYVKMMIITFCITVLLGSFGC
jgi:hypothetical protein